MVWHPLKDETARLEVLAADNTAGPLRDECGRIMKAWSAAAFGTSGEAELRRYFSFQLKGLTAMDTASLGGEQQSLLLGLVDHIAYYYPSLFDHDATAPACFCRRELNSLSEQLAIFHAHLNKLTLPAALANCLLAYTASLNEGTGHTFRTLAYYRLFLEKMAFPVLKETTLNALLLEINFNHLGYFAWLQETFEKEGNNYRQLLARYAGRPVNKVHIYHTAWPSLNEMICGWLAEAIKLEESIVPPKPTPKLPLDLSVSHLAFLTRLFQEEGIYGNTPLAGIFKFLAEHYTTKRQLQISAGSLSKEFYSTDQQAAARVRGLLQNMVARINKNYFP